MSIVPSKKVVMQRHHDYYVTLQRRGELKVEDEPQYQLAINRENEGTVEPIPEEKPSSDGSFDDTFNGL